MTPDDVTPHVCDSGNFDRTICPDPCGAMHSFCDTCGQRQDPCAHEPTPDDVKARAVEVLAMHLRLDFHPREIDETGRKPWTCRSCGVLVAHGMDDLDVARIAHQADMLAAAGLLAAPDALAKAVEEDRRESWDWFLGLLRLHGYEGQPVWDEAVALRRQAIPRTPRRDHAAAEEQRLTTSTVTALAESEDT
jgi:hypothetical protein